MGDRFGKGGIADRMIWFKGFPFLDNKEEHTFGVPVSHVMIKEVTSLPSSGMSLHALETTLARSKYQGFPVIEDRATKILIGYVGRTELQYAINRVKTEGFISPHAQCLFTPPSTTAVHTPSATAAPPVTLDVTEPSSGPQRVDFSRFINPTPLTVHPRLPLETVMEVFKKMGPRVILIDYRGRLAGLVTVKDCLKYQFKVEAQETGREQAALEAWERWLGGSSDIPMERWSLPAAGTRGFDFSGVGRSFVSPAGIFDASDPRRDGERRSRNRVVGSRVIVFW